MKYEDILTTLEECGFKIQTSLDGRKRIDGAPIRRFVKFVDTVVQREKEECAYLCVDLSDGKLDRNPYYDCADAIRTKE